jgi:predicted RNase H-like nuclease (RuvC/YqgF family)
MPAQLTGWYALLYALLLAGFGKYLIDFFRLIKRHWSASRPEMVAEAQVHRQVEIANQSVVTVTRSTERLEADNERLRQEITEISERYSADRQAWWTERTQLVAEHVAARLECRKEIEALKDDVDELEGKWRAALDQLAGMREQMNQVIRRQGGNDGTT